MKCFVFTSLFLMMANLVYGQGVNVEQLKQQAKAAGYSDSQIEAAINQVKKDRNEEPGSSQIKPGSEVMTVPGTSQEPVFVNQPAQAAPPHSGQSQMELKKFGVDLLSSVPSSFDPNEYGPVPDNYVIGTGDKLQLSVWGQSEFYLEAEVDRRGMIQIPTVGLVAVSGLTLKKAESVLSERLSKSYAGIRSGESRFSVTLSKVRSIRVFVGGFVNRPGAYKLTAIASVLTAVYAAGGVTPSADLRQVAIIRPDGEVGEVDLYSNLLGLPVKGDDRLDHNYIVMVKGESRPLIVTGSVNRPGIYDLKPGESLLDLLAFAGGATPDAWLGNVQINRLINGEGRRILSADARNPLEPVALQAGDEVYIPVTQKRQFGTIELTGAVRQPGKVEYKPGMTVRDAIEAVGGLNPWTYMERGQIRIVEPDSSFRMEVFHPEKALAGDPSENKILSDNSTLILKSIWQVTPRFTIDVVGYVNSPGKLPFHESMTVGDAVFLANGFQDEAWTGTIEVSRVDPKDSTATDRKIAYISQINNPGDLNRFNQALTFPLKPMDQVYIRKNPFFERQRTVKIEGEVKFPGSYSLTDKDETLYSVIRRAGGLKSTAYLSAGRLFREKDKIGFVAINFENAILDPQSEDNVILVPGDVITVPERDNTVRIRGEVAVQTSVLYNPGSSVNYYLSEAGGLKEFGDLRKTYVILPNGRIFTPSKYWIYQPEIIAGSTIVVPVKEQEDPIDWKGWVTITTSTLTSLITVLVLLQRTN
ncbi:MAG: SLBB domain-containing protein [Bacteroidetes bacterium]|nr:SLBB domain-containing protein [Bacteroidota bacterium]